MMIAASVPDAVQPEPQAAAHQVFLVDDNDSFRRSTRWLLEGHGFRVDAFASPRHFLAFIETLPDEDTDACILLDIRMPEMSGLEVQEALRRGGCGLPVVFISGHALVAALGDALERAAQQRRHPSESDGEARERLASLTARERQVLDLAVEGMLNKVIADRLGISIKTVELHRSRVMAKMKAKSIAQLVQLTMRGR
jgi:two-component system, LuxR family, response regulator FixJ